MLVLDLRHFSFIAETHSTWRVRTSNFFWVNRDLWILLKAVQLLVMFFLLFLLSGLTGQPLPQL